jgi:hypothetical protein
MLMDIMDVDPDLIGYMRQAWNLGRAPRTVKEIEFNTDLQQFKTHKFHYKRDPVDYLAWLGFHSRFITYLVYLSPLRKFAHNLVRLLRGGSRQVDEYYTGIVEKNSPG